MASGGASPAPLAAALAVGGRLPHSPVEDPAALPSARLPPVSASLSSLLLPLLP